MEIQLQELIDQIKKDGFEVAENEASSIVASANEKAERIIADAKAEAERILAEAKKENEQLVRSSEDAIRQAGRNLLISFRESVANELDSVVGEKISEVYSSEKISEIIVNVVEAWSKNADIDDISVLLNENDAEKLEEGILAALKERMLGGVTIKPNDNFDGGFRIAVNNGSAYYDYSNEAVTEMLSTYLNPRVKALMKEAE